RRGVVESFVVVVTFGDHLYAARRYRDTRVLCGLTSTLTKRSLRARVPSRSARADEGAPPPPARRSPPSPAAATPASSPRRRPARNDRAGSSRTGSSGTSSPTTAATAPASAG